MCEVATKDKMGETYNMVELVRMVHGILGVLRSKEAGYMKLTDFTSGKLGHDRLYAIDVIKVSQSGLELEGRKVFEMGLRQIVGWCLDNQGWYNYTRNGCFCRWKRLGMLQWRPRR